MRRLTLAFLSVGFVLATEASALAADDGMSIQVLHEWQYFNDKAWRALNRNDLKEAEIDFHLAIRTVRPYADEDRRLLARGYSDLAWVLYQQGRHAEAEPLAKWALTVREKHRGVKADSVFQSLYVLGMIERSLKHYAEAENALKKAIAIQEKSLGPGRPETATTIDDLASVYADEGRSNDAEILYKHALAIREKTLPADHPDIAENLEHYAAMLRRAKRIPDAIPLEERAKTIRAALMMTELRSRVESKKSAAARGGSTDFRAPRPMTAGPRPAAP